MDPMRLAEEVRQQLSEILKHLAEGDLKQALNKLFLVRQNLRTLSQLTSQEPDHRQLAKLAGRILNPVSYAHSEVRKGDAAAATPQVQLAFNEWKARKSVGA